METPMMQPPASAEVGTAGRRRPMSLPFDGAIEVLMASKPSTVRR